MHGIQQYSACLLLGREDWFSNPLFCYKRVHIKIYKCKLYIKILFKLKSNVNNLWIKNVHFIVIHKVIHSIHIEKNIKKIKNKAQKRVT